MASGTVEIIAGGLSAPEILTFDYANSKVYWTDDGARDVFERASFDGSELEFVHTAGGFRLRIAVEPSRAEVYWADPMGDEINVLP